MKPWHVVLGGLGLLALAVAGAQAQRVLGAGNVSPPVPPTLSLAPATPPRMSPGEEILAEARRICVLLHEPGLTARQIADRLGRVTDDDAEMGLDVKPANPYIKLELVSLGMDDEGNATNSPDAVRLQLMHPTDLPLRMLEASLGPTSETYESNHAAAVIRDPQQAASEPCKVIIATNWDTSVAPRDTVVMELFISR